MEKPEDEIKTLVARGKKQGYLTYEEINRLVPDDAESQNKIDIILSALDEADPLNRLARIVPVVRSGPRRLRHEPSAFVIAKRLDVHRRLLRHLSDRESVGFHKVESSART